MRVRTDLFAKAPSGSRLATAVSQAQLAWHLTIAVALAGGALAGVAAIGAAVTIAIPTGMLDLPAARALTAAVVIIGAPLAVAALQLERARRQVDQLAVAAYWAANRHVGGLTAGLSTVQRLTVVHANDPETFAAELNVLSVPGWQRDAFKHGPKTVAVRAAAN